jgi:uncharacterized sulfatase
MPQDKQGLHLSQDLNDSRIGQYFQAINYTDRQIGLFLDHLKSGGLLDSTLVAIYGDHIGVHLYFEDEIDKMKNKEPWFVNHDKKIPLFILGANFAPREISTLGGHVDIMPTLLGLLGVDKSVTQNTARGRNLLFTKYNYVFLPFGGIRGDYPFGDGATASREAQDISDRIISASYFGQAKR